MTPSWLDDTPTPPLRFRPYRSIQEMEYGVVPIEERRREGVRKEIERAMAPVVIAALFTGAAWGLVVRAIITGEWP